MAVRRTFFFVSVAALLLALLSSNVTANDLNRASFLELDSRVSIPVKFVSKGSPSSLDQLLINYSWLPENDYRQQVLSMSSYPDGDFKDDHVMFEINVIRDFILDVDFRTRVSSDYVKIDEKIKFPIQNLDSSLVKYTEPTELIDIDNDIRSLAASLAGDEDDLYVVVFRLADWVNTNINYSLSTLTSEASLPSSWVLEERMGVCDELSNLFISMARSLGIPARFVSGIAYTESELFSENWGAHGWAEVYFPGYGWVPFDPTYNQLGYVDATHIKLSADFESNKYSTLYSWSGRNIDVVPGKLSIDVDVVSKGEDVSPDVDISVDVYRNLVGFGSYNVVMADITNKRDYYVSKAVSLTRITDVYVSGELKQDILLKPRETKRLYWVLKIDDDLQRNYFYKYPLQVYTQTGEEGFSQFEARWGSDKISLAVAESIYRKPEVSFSDVEMSCVPLHKAIYEGENVTAVCTLESNRERTSYICFEDFCRRFSFNKGSNEFEFEIPSGNAGFKTFLVRYNNGEESAFVSFIVLDETESSIEHLNFPTRIKYDYASYIDFVLRRNSQSIPLNVSVVLEHDFFRQEWSLDSLRDSQGFSFSFSGKDLKAGENEFIISVEYFDERGKKFGFEQEVIVEVYDLTFGQKVRLWFNGVIAYMGDLI